MAEIALRRFGWTAAVVRALSIAVAVLGNGRSALRRSAPRNPCDPRAKERAVLERALERASGTWGGYQATRPFNYRQRSPD